MSTALPRDYVSKYYTHFESVGLPVVPEIIDELLYQLAHAEIDPDAVTGLRFYRTGDSEQYYRYKAIEAEAQGTAWEALATIGDDIYVIGCHQ